MTHLKVWFARLAGAFGKARRDRDLTAELDAHLQAHIDDNLRAGMAPERARRDARLKLGGVDVAKEQMRDRRGLPFLETSVHDVHYALRTLRANPAFAAVAVLTLALGIGANAAIFSVVHAVLLKPLPYADPGRLVTLTSYIPAFLSRVPSLPMRAIDFDEMRRSNTVFEGMSAIAPADFNLTGAGDPERLHGARVSSNLFSLLGAQPEQGMRSCPRKTSRAATASRSSAMTCGRAALDPTPGS